MRIALLGGTGRIGSHVLTWALANFVNTVLVAIATESGLAVLGAIVAEPTGARPEHGGHEHALARQAVKKRVFVGDEPADLLGAVLRRNAASDPPGQLRSGHGGRQWWQIGSRTLQGGGHLG